MSHFPSRGQAVLTPWWPCLTSVLHSVHTSPYNAKQNRSVLEWYDRQIILVHEREVERKNASRMFDYWVRNHTIANNNYYLVWSQQSWWHHWL